MEKNEQTKETAMNEDVRPVRIESDSPQRVAIDLMRHISGHEGTEDRGRQDRRYWLGLYIQCLRATQGESLENIMKDK
jgi:hypothetical protein